MWHAYRKLRACLVAPDPTVSSVRHFAPSEQPVTKSGIDTLKEREAINVIDVDIGEACGNQLRGSHPYGYDGSSGFGILYWDVTVSEFGAVRMELLISLDYAYHISINKKFYAIFYPRRSGRQSRKIVIGEFGRTPFYFTRLCVL